MRAAAAAAAATTTAAAAATTTTEELRNGSRLTFDEPAVAEDLVPREAVDPLWTTESRSVFNQLMQRRLWHVLVLHGQDQALMRRVTAPETTQQEGVQIIQQQIDVGLLIDFCPQLGDLLLNNTECFNRILTWVDADA